MSNLPTLSKLLDRVVSVQLVRYLTLAGLLPKHQLAYRKFHSTETALLKVFTDSVEEVDNGDHALLGLLDLSAAFDSRSRHSDRVPLGPTAYAQRRWTGKDHIYVGGANQCTSMGCGHRCVLYPVEYLESVLGPLLFLL